MKYFYLGLLILGLCLLLCVAVISHLDACVEEATTRLEQAAAGFPGTAPLVEEALRLWDSHRGFLGMTLRHDAADEVAAAFRRLAAYARRGDGEEFQPACAELIEQLRQLSEMEKPAYYNILAALPRP